MTKQGFDDFEKKHSFLIAIDSDGCVFDTMELKHKECFIPCLIKHFKLQSISKLTREVAEFVNLYSAWRGVNRFPALIRTLALLAERPEVLRRNISLPTLSALQDWIEQTSILSNQTLQTEVEKTQNPELAQALNWSEEVNQLIAEMVQGVTPFPGVNESLQQISQQADLIVCSATPFQALKTEWEEHGLASLIGTICGQETGTKTMILQQALELGYAADKILMLGDAPGDLKAAQTVGAQFYPINPSQEEASWERFLQEISTLFFQDQYQGKTESACIANFENMLPQTPPWKSLSS